MEKVVIIDRLQYTCFAYETWVKTIDKVLNRNQLQHAHLYLPT